MHYLLNQFILGCLFALAIYSGYVATEPSQARLAVMREAPSESTTRFKITAPAPTTEREDWVPAKEAARLTAAGRRSGVEGGRAQLTFDWQ